MNLCCPFPLSLLWNTEKFLSWIQRPPTMSPTYHFTPSLLAWTTSLVTILESYLITTPTKISTTMTIDVGSNPVSSNLVWGYCYSFPHFPYSSAIGWPIRTLFNLSILSEGPYLILEILSVFGLVDIIIRFRG